MTDKYLDKLFNDLLAIEVASSEKIPSVHMWNPQLTGDMDLVIDREGRWVHEGGEIKRPALVKLFSSILKKENGEYFLVTPVEKWRITVVLAPFFITSVQRNIRGREQAISCLTSVGDSVVIGPDHRIWIDYEEGSEEPIPLVHIRYGLPGLLSRNAFYQLVEWADCHKEGREGQLTISSMGKTFPLGIAA
jgi:hypothetical protein